MLMVEGGSLCLRIIEPCSRGRAGRLSNVPEGQRRVCGDWCRASRGPVAESAVDPLGPIPNPIVTHRSAGEY